MSRHDQREITEGPVAIGDSKYIEANCKSEVLSEPLGHGSDRWLPVMRSNDIESVIEQNLDRDLFTMDQIQDLARVIDIALRGVKFEE